MPTTHTVKQGESVISLSEDAGLFAPTIWNDPANAELKKKRKDMNVLLPGDVLVIPDIRPKQAEGATGKRHVFRRKGIPALFRLQIFENEEPRANQDYTLTVDGETYEGKTDDEGILQEFLPTGSKQGELVIGPDEFEIELQFGHLDPHDEIVGIQKRLNNIGYDCGEPDGELNDAMQAALTEFQKRFELKQTGKANEATIKKLAEIHDSQHEYPEESSE